MLILFFPQSQAIKTYTLFLNNIHNIYVTHILKKI